MTPPNSIDDVNKLIDAFGGLRPMASKMGIAVSTVQGWKKRGKIPENRWSDVVKIAEKHHITLPDAQASGTPDSDKTKKEPEDLLSFGGDDDGAISGFEFSAAAEPDKPEEKKKSTEGFGALLSGDSDSVVEETEFLGAFNDGRGGDDKASGISEDIWAHAALPRSTGVHWAILLSLISIALVVTRPIWSGPVDSKLSAQIGHSEESAPGETESDQHSTEKTSKTTIIPEALEERLIALEELGAVIAGSETVQNSGLNFKPLEQRFSIFENRQAEFLDSFSALRNRLETSETRNQAMTLLIDRLKIFNDSLSLRLDSVERRQGRQLIDSFEQRIALLFNLENLHNRIDAGQSYEDTLKALEESMDETLRHKSNEALSTLTLYSARGVTRYSFLLEEYQNRLAHAIAVRKQSNADGWREQIFSRIQNLVHVRLANPEKSEDFFIQAETLLIEGKLRQAVDLVIVEVEKLEGESNLEAWIVKTNELLDAQQAVEILRQTILDDLKALENAKTSS